MAAHVYISCAETDIGYAAGLARVLGRTGLGVEYAGDPELERGLAARLEAIRNSFVVIVILSPEAVESVRLREEVRYALRRGVWIHSLLLPHEPAADSIALKVVEDLDRGRRDIFWLLHTVRLAVEIFLGMHQGTAFGEVLSPVPPEEQTGSEAERTLRRTEKKQLRERSAQFLKELEEQVKPLRAVELPRPWSTHDFAPHSVNFMAAYQHLVQRGLEYPLTFLVYSYDADPQAMERVLQLAPRLGPRVAVARAATTERLAPSTRLTIVPNVVGAVFQPERIDLVVDGHVKELTFTLTVTTDAALGLMDGFIDVFAGPLIVGQVPIEFAIEESDIDVGTSVDFGSADLVNVANTGAFEKIFLSYAHHDSSIVDLCAEVYRALGVRVLLDRADLLSGDDWRIEIERLIRGSDILQLYWSSSSASSLEVEREWRLALEVGVVRTRFIRPLFWERPMPTAPELLRHLHFSHLNLAELRKIVGRVASGADKGVAEVTD